MPRAGLSHDRVVAEAAAMVDEVGLQNLNVSVLADRLGVRQPSLYKHIDGVGALRRSISIGAKRELAELMARAAAGRAKGDALVAMSTAYRGWAHRHPGRYSAAQTAPAPDDGEDRIASDAVVQIFLDVLAGYGLQETDAIDAIRALRSGLHGFITLEASGGFGLPVDVDRSFDRMVAVIIGSFSHWSQ